MHVFIDTNVFLNFFHFSKDDLDALNDVFATHKHGSATVYLTEQVRDELRRNREAKIKDALKRFGDVKYTTQLPSFMKAYDEFAEIQKLAGLLHDKVKSIREKADKDIERRNLLADNLIKSIFEKSPIIEMSEAIFKTAFQRMQLGNPPGKNKSIGDAVNWVILLEEVPPNEDVHIISEDGDYFSSLNENRVHPFLEQEWREKKNSSIRVYRTLSAFLGEHFDGVAFSFDNDKNSLIDDLMSSGSFAITHSIVSKLEEYDYFSLKEVERILQAASDNNQFGWIVQDYDVSDFLNRIAIPRRQEIKNDEFLRFLKIVKDEQDERKNI